jgi:hypothetical protein
MRFPKDLRTFLRLPGFFRGFPFGSHGVLFLREALHGRIILIFAGKNRKKY